MVLHLLAPDSFSNFICDRSSLNYGHIQLFLALQIHDALSWLQTLDHTLPTTWRTLSMPTLPCLLVCKHSGLLLGITSVSSQVLHTPQLLVMV